MSAQRQDTERVDSKCSGAPLVCLLSVYQMSPDTPTPYLHTVNVTKTGGGKVWERLVLRPVNLIRGVVEG